MSKNKKKVEYDKSAPFRPKQQYIDGYYKLTEDQKEKILEPELPDYRAFNAFLSLNHDRNIGFKRYCNCSSIMQDNPILSQVWLFRVITKAILWHRLIWGKISNLLYIYCHGHTPKKIYFIFRALKDYHNKQEKEL